MQLLTERRKIPHTLNRLAISTNTTPRHEMPQELPLLSSNRRLVNPKGNPARMLLSRNASSDTR